MSSLREEHQRDADRLERFRHEIGGAPHVARRAPDAAAPGPPSRSAARPRARTRPAGCAGSPPARRRAVVRRAPQRRHGAHHVAARPDVPGRPHREGEALVRALAVERVRLRGRRGPCRPGRRAARVPSLCSLRPLNTATVTLREPFPSAPTGHTIRDGAISTSTGGTTNSGRRTSPSASSSCRHTTSRRSATLTPAIVVSIRANSGGGWSGSPFRLSGTPDQSYSAPWSGRSRKYGCGQRRVRRHASP